MVKPPCPGCGRAQWQDRRPVVGRPWLACEVCGDIVHLTVTIAGQRVRVADGLPVAVGGQVVGHVKAAYPSPARERGKGRVWVAVRTPDGEIRRFMQGQLELADLPGYKVGGWKQKYIIQKADGSPVDPAAVYFVLRLDADPHARRAAMAYAESVQGDNPTFARDIQLRVRAIEHGMEFPGDDETRDRRE